MIYEWKKKAETELVKASTYCVEQYGRNIANKFIDAIDQQVNHKAFQDASGENK